MSAEQLHSPGNTGQGVMFVGSCSVDEVENTKLKNTNLNTTPFGLYSLSLRFSWEEKWTEDMEGGTSAGTEAGCLLTRRQKGGKGRMWWPETET